MRLRLEEYDIKAKVIEIKGETPHVFISTSSKLMFMSIFGALYEWSAF